MSLFRLRCYKLWLSRAPGYLGTRDEKSGLNLSGSVRATQVSSPQRRGAATYFGGVLPAANHIAEEDCESGILVQREVHGGRRRNSHAIFRHITNDSDDLTERFVGRKGEPQALPNRILPAGVTLHPSLRSE